MKLLRAWSTKRTATLTKPFSRFGEDTQKRTGALMHSVKQRVAIMLALIPNAIYRQFLRAALAGIARQGGKL